MLKKLLTVILSLMFITSMLALPVNANASVSINASSVTICINQSIKVTTKKKNPKWSSSNKKVATVSSKGLVNGKKVGKAVITCEANRAKYKITVYVKNHSLKLDKKNNCKKCAHCKKVFPVAGTYAGIKIKNANDVVNLYNKAYNKTKIQTKSIPVTVKPLHTIKCLVKNL